MSSASTGGRSVLRPVGRYHVYVVELDEAAREKAPRGERRPGPCVYVGETGRTPEERLAVHKAGGPRAASIVTRFGVRLLPSLATRGPFLTRAGAARGEKRVGDQLRRKGYVVFGGNGKTVDHRLHGDGNPHPE